MLPTTYESCRQWITDASGTNASTPCPTYNCCSLGPPPNDQFCSDYGYYCHNYGPSADYPDGYNRACQTYPPSNATRECA